MNYRIIPPPTVLQEYIRYFWILEDPPAGCKPKTFHTLVDDSSGLIIQHREGKSAFVSSQGQDLKTAFVYGQATVPSTTFSNGGFQLTGVHFHPHALKTLFGVDAHCLTDQMNELDAVNCTEIGKKLYDSDSPEENIRLLTGFFLHRLNRPLKKDELVCYCIERIQALGGQLSVTELSRDCRISERQLERRFKVTVGISPKLYIRIVRFQFALRLMRQKQFSKLSDIAFELGYADQSHFIRDIREFSNYTPKGLSQEVSDLIINLHLGPQDP